MKMPSSSSSSSSEYSVWIWMTVGIVGYKLCASAIEVYGFCDAWNRISRTHRADMKNIRLAKTRLFQRRIRIDEAVTTQPFRSNMKKAQQQLSHERTRAVSSTCGSSDVETCCPICLSDFQDGEMVSVSSSSQPLACRHLFHKDCLGAWLSKHNSCPVCRFEMLSAVEPVPSSTLSSSSAESSHGQLASQILFPESTAGFYSAVLVNR